MPLLTHQDQIDQQRKQRVGAALRARIQQRAQPVAKPDDFKDPIATLPVRAAPNPTRPTPEETAARKLRELYMGGDQKAADDPLARALLKIHSGTVKSANALGVGKEAHAIARPLDRAGAVIETQVIPAMTEPAAGNKFGHASAFDAAPHREAGVGGALAYLGGNLLKDAARFSLGFPAGVAGLAQHPIRGAETIGKGYAEAYGPLAHGHLGEFAGDVGQHPLNYLLDASALAKVAGGAARLEQRVPVERRVEFDGGHVQPMGSPNPVARAVQHRFDRWSEKNPQAPVLGARDRVARRLPFEQEREFERTGSAALPFVQARKALNKKNGEDMAFDVMYRYGDEQAAQLLQREIDMRVARLESGGDPVTRGVRAGARKGDPDVQLYQLKGDPKRVTDDPAQAETSMNLTERRGQVRTIAQLKTAMQHVAAPSDALKHALEEGRKLGDHLQEVKVAMGAVDEGQAAARAQMHPRLVTGGEFVDMPAPSKALTDARAYRDRIQRLYDKAQGRVDKNVEAELAKADERVQQLEGQVASPPVRPRTREEAQARLAELERAHAQMMRKMELQASRAPLAKEEAHAKIAELDAKIAEHQGFRAAADDMVRQLEADRPKLTPEELGQKYGVHMEAGATSTAHKTYGAQHYARSKTHGRIIRRLERERARYVDALKTGYLKIQHDAGETGRRNLARSRGVKIPTLQEEFLHQLEEQLAAVVAKHPDHPVSRAHLARQDEIAQLRQALGDAHPLGDNPGGQADFGAVVDEPARAALEQGVERARLGRIGNRVVGEGSVRTPRGGPLAERLGGALSVAQDRVQRLETAAQRRHGVIPGDVGGRELVGGIEAPGARYLKDTSRLPTSAIARRVRSVTGKPQPLTKHSEGILFSQGRARRGSRLLLEDFAHTARHRQQIEDIKRVESFSKPLNPSVPGGLDPGHTYFNPEGVSLPRRFKDATEEDLTAMTPKEFAQAMKENEAALNADLFPSEADLANLPDRIRNKVRQVDVKIKEALELQGSHGEALSALARIFDTTNNTTKMGLIYLKGSYVPTNFTGNVGFLALQQGPRTVPSLIRAAGLQNRQWAPGWVRRTAAMMSDLQPTTLRRIDIEVGSGASHALGGEGQGITGRITRKVADASGALADRLPRRAAWLDEAAKRGYKTDAEVLELLDNPDLRPVLNQVSETAENALVKFRGQKPFERKVISRAFFIYPWLKGATRYGARLSIDRPITADIASHIGEYGADEAQKILGRIVSYLDGIVPVGKIENRFGARVIPVTNPGPITPVGTAGQVGAAIGAAIGAGPSRRALRPIAFASPVAKGLVEAATGYDTFKGKSYPDKTGAAHIFLQSLLGTPERSNFPLIESVRTAFKDPQTKNFEGPANTQPNYVQEGGPIAALKQAFLGSTRVRLLNVDAAQAKGFDERMADLEPPERAKARAQKKQADIIKEAIRVGVISTPAELPDEIGPAFALQQRREVEYAKAAQRLGIPSNRLKLLDRFKVDVALSVQIGDMDAGDAKGIVETASQMSDNELKSYRRDFLDELFNNSILSDFREAIRDSGGKT